MLRACPLFAALALVVTAFAASAHAASFNCSKASTPRERTVCSTPALSILDDKLASAYASARAELSPASAALFASDQREWLAHIDALCPPARTLHQSDPDLGLTQEYTERIAQLHLIQHEGGMTFFPRYHAILVSAKAPQTSSPPPPVPGDPGFGYGTFLWPQIDNPTPTEQAWNTAVYRRLIDITGGKKAKSLDESVDAEGYTNSFYDLRAANASLIDIDLGVSTYGWGAAHPNTDLTSFPWWLDQQRPLTIADIFRSDSSQQTAMVDLVLSKLNVQPSEPYIKAADLRKSIAENIADPTSWDISRDAASIRFGLYAIAPYAVGMPEAKLSWTDLRLYLNPNFDPASLPPPRQPLSNTDH